MLLLAPTRSGLQALMRTYKNYSIDIVMCVNVKKSMLIGFGRNVPCTELFDGVVILACLFSTTVLLLNVILKMQRHIF
jgi:hypothetical protein